MKTEHAESKSRWQGYHDELDEEPWHDEEPEDWHDSKPSVASQWRKAAKEEPEEPELGYYYGVLEDEGDDGGEFCF